MLIASYTKEETAIQSKFVHQIPFFRFFSIFMKTQGNLPGCANWLIEPILLYIISCLLEVKYLFYV